MPTFYAAGENIQSGTVKFNGVKTMTVAFLKAFNVSPSVTFTLGEENNSPPYRKEVSKTQFKIKFQSNFTGDVDWIAIANGA